VRLVAELPDDLMEMAFSYWNAVTSEQPCLEIWRSMVSGFGDTDTKMALDRASEIFTLLDPKKEAKILWDAGLAIKDHRSWVTTPQPSS
jgi:hypothetical protein